MYFVLFFFYNDMLNNKLSTTRHQAIKEAAKIPPLKKTLQVIIEARITQIKSKKIMIKKYHNLEYLRSASKQLLKLANFQ